MGSSNTHFPSLRGSLSHGPRSVFPAVRASPFHQRKLRRLSLSARSAKDQSRPCSVTWSLSGTGRLFRGVSVHQDSCLTFRGEAVDEEGGRGGAVTIEGAEGAVGGGRVVSLILEVLACPALCLQETPMLSLGTQPVPNASKPDTYTQLLGRWSREWAGSGSRGGGTESRSSRPVWSSE